MKRSLTATMSVFVFTVGVAVSPIWGQNANDGVADQIRDIEEQFRVAKLRNDVQSLDRILDEAFVETNQNGNSRTKNETIELFRTFPIQSLVTNSSAIRLAASSALVTGSQTEVNRSGIDRMLFTRVYIKSGDRWRLLASSQFRDPK